MCSAISALNGASFEGAVTVAETGLRGMITIRGNFADKGFVAALEAVLAAKLPVQRKTTSGKAGRLVWMSPDELLAVVDYDAAPALAAELRRALAGQHHLAEVVSDARAVFLLGGTGWREVLAKGSPADLAVTAFGAGDARRSRLGQVAVAFWMVDAETCELVCFRSVSGFVFDWLKTAAAPDTLPGYLR
ncbi:MAG: sarcosine oxidase subunit gamma family protein [Paracoccaceae bacterium]